jgi:ribosome maturation factor RimP
LAVNGSVTERLEALLAPLAAALGLEWLGLEHTPAGRHTRLRLYVDAPGGITLEGCERMSREAGALLDVEDPIPGGYVLEVSSPGSDRPLFTLEQAARFVGQRVQVESALPISGQRRFTGLLLEPAEGRLRLAVEGRELELPWQTVRRARLAPQFAAPAKPGRSQRRTTGND